VSFPLKPILLEWVFDPHYVVAALSREPRSSSNSNRVLGWKHHALAWWNLRDIRPDGSSDCSH